MKNEEALNKAFRVFQGDEDDALLRLAILKERADYRAYFSENIGKVKAAPSRRNKRRVKGDPPDAKTENTVRRFREEMLRRFGILPSSYAARPIEEWASFFDPLTDARESPGTVRRYILPWLFYWPGVREVVSLTPPESVVTVIKGKGNVPGSSRTPSANRMSGSTRSTSGNNPLNCCRNSKRPLTPWTRAGRWSRRNMRHGSRTAVFENRTGLREKDGRGLHR